jgi:NitT/TauT family transport system substrate-binding protein
MNLLSKKHIVACLIVITFSTFFSLAAAASSFSLIAAQAYGVEHSANPSSVSIGMAVEFMDHAACAYVAQDKGWFKKKGLTLSTYESYVTGIALASAMARGDIQVAYICLVPAINVFANAKVPIKIVAGTHKYGYGLVVNPNKIKTIKDLENPSLRIGCVREGGAVDVLFRKIIDTYHLDQGKLVNNIRRMDPPKMVLAIKMGQLDAAFLPEQWATMAEDCGMHMLLTSKAVWPCMQGSVLVVKEGLLKDQPDVVKKLVTVTQEATNWINHNPHEAAVILAKYLSVTGGTIIPAEATNIIEQLDNTPEILSRSMKRLDYSTDLDLRVIQETIDYMVKLGYIKQHFKAEDIVDLRWLHGE